MQDAFESPLPAPQKEPEGIFRHPAVIALTTLFGVAALYLLFFRGPVPSSNGLKQRLPFGAAEQAYAPKLQLDNFAMSEAENFLHQERPIFDHLFEVALNGGELLRPRMLLVNALENQSRRRPDMVREYLDRLALLQQQSPLAEGTGSKLVDKGVSAVTEKAQPPAATG